MMTVTLKKICSRKGGQTGKPVKKITAVIQVREVVAGVKSVGY